jgi:hypothetical protein
MTQITSDGGSSSYYEIVLPKGKVKPIFSDDPESMFQQTGWKIEVKDVIKHGMDNDFDRGNIFKALFRLGKKAGAEEIYDLRKCQFFINEMIKDYEQSV